MDKELEIQKEIRDKVFTKCFRSHRRNKYKIGRDILYKYYLKYYDTLKNIETKRIIIYNLAYAERMLGNEEMVAVYILQLKEDMDKVEGYKEVNTAEYCNMLSYYSDCEFIKISENEALDNYIYSYNYYKELYNINKSIYTKIRMINLKFNVHRLQKNKKGMSDTIMEICIIDNVEGQSTYEQMMRDIKKIDRDLHSTLLNKRGVTVGL